MNKIYKGYFCKSRNTDLKYPMCFARQTYLINVDKKSLFKNEN